MDYPERVDIDEQYVRDWSLGLDLRILARTPKAVVMACDALLGVDEMLVPTVRGLPGIEDHDRLRPRTLG